ncbi:CASPA protein, partial [Sapayoa aenigma]|nr:CASPA protein [Sapayoa aenigma]
SSNMEDVVSLEFHQQLLYISENLVAEDIAALKFLCTDLLSLRKLEGVKSAVDIFNLLMAEEYLNAEDTFLVAELLYRIKCHFLLKTLGYTQEKVQECLHEKGRVSPYRQMLYELSENITNEKVKNITFLLQEQLPKRWTALSALDLLILLEKQGLLTENNVQILEEVCRKVSPDLLKKINCYKKAKGRICPCTMDIFVGQYRYKQKTCLCHKNIFNKNNQKHIQNSSFEHAISYEVFIPFNETVFPIQKVRYPFSLSFLQKMTSYKMDGPQRGFCLVINNVTFNSSERKGSNKDAEELKQVFTWLGLDVRIYRNQTSEQIKELMETWQRLQDHKDRNCFICCILSHGESGAIYGTDEKLVSIRTIMSHFTAKQCPQLAEKPKLFFIQACQGKKIQCPVYVDVDAQIPELSSVKQNIPLSESIPEEADFLLGMATVDGCVSFRDIEQGTWYIQALCSKLQLLVPRGEDILSILTEVNEDVARRVSRTGTKKQMPQPAYTLRRKFIFPIPRDPPPS